MLSLIVMSAENTYQGMAELWPILVYAGLALLIAGGMVVLSYFLGEKHKEKVTEQPYEAGIPVTGSARLQFSSQFYLIAMFFVIFDLDAAFLIGWAIAFREVGWAGYIGAAIFTGVLLAILIYEWRIGALNYGPVGKQILKGMKKHQQKT
ncbi:MAG: NADH-quinone oxidoreductase subunit A [Bacteroidales bacterium]|nr:NADH-quinone oxidoreductase subunit A [Bacteroidales bacterium]